MNGLRPAPSSNDREVLLQAAAQLLAETPFESVSLTDVALAAGVTEQHMRIHFSDMVALGNAILDRERVSMHEIMRALGTEQATSLEKLVLAFERVGWNLRNDVVVRAGVRMAAESRSSFPSRRLDPFATWRTFVLDLLHQAAAEGEMQENTDVDEAARVIVAAGMGTKDLIAGHGTWDDAPVQMASTAQILVHRIGRLRPSSSGTLQ